MDDIIIKECEILEKMDNYFLVIDKCSKVYLKKCETIDDVDEFLDIADVIQKKLYDALKSIQLLYPQCKKCPLPCKYRQTIKSTFSYGKIFYGRLLDFLDDIEEEREKNKSKGRGR